MTEQINEKFGRVGLITYTDQRIMAKQINEKFGRVGLISTDYSRIDQQKIWLDWADNKTQLWLKSLNL